MSRYYNIFVMQPETIKRYDEQQIFNLNRISSQSSSGHCGYCNRYQSFSWGFTKQVMHPYTYQLMAEKGWRRSGTYYYKPDIEKSCCKLWTHRMDVNRYRPRHNQKKTLKEVSKWLKSKFVEPDKKSTEHQKNENIQKTKGKQIKEVQMAGKKIEKGKNEQANIKQHQMQEKWMNYAYEVNVVLEGILKDKKQEFFSLFSAEFTQLGKEKQFSLSVDKQKIKCFASAENAESDFYSNQLMILFGKNKKLLKQEYTNVEFFKAIKEFILKQLRKIVKSVQLEVQRSGYLLFTEFDSRKMQKKELKKLQSEKEKEKEKSTQMEIEKGKKVKETTKEKKKIEDIQQKDKGKDQKMRDFNQPQVYQLVIKDSQILFGPLSIEIVKAEVTTQSWKMYQRYCVDIHEKPEKSQSSYSGFLCEKALKYCSEKAQNNEERSYKSSWQQKSNEQKGRPIPKSVVKSMGCYHMKYYLGNQLIGVGVVDIFPDGLSSVYFFYEPKYKDLRLGVFSTLIEIQYVRWMSLSFPQFQYYYLGFYIQNCQKMEYKGNYEPFDLLCPISYQFVECTKQIRELIQKIEKKQVKDIRLSKNTERASEMNFTNDLGVYISQNIKIKYQGKNISLRDLNPSAMVKVLVMLREMVKIWGKNIFERITFTF